MADSYLTKLSFEKGLLESQEDSMTPEGFATTLENWVPEPHGGLRCRRGWLNGSTTGVPATRKGRGIAHFSQAFRTPAIVQSAEGTATSVGATSVAATWGAATTAGNLLVAVVSLEATAGSTLAISGWTLAVENESETGRAGAVIFYKANASSESGTVTATTDIAGRMSLHIMEVSGCTTTSPLDEVAQAETTTQTTHSYGTTASLDQEIEFAVAALGCGSLEDVTVPAGWTELRETDNSASFTLSTAYKLTSSIAAVTGAPTTGTTTSANGAVATFKAKAESDYGEWIVANMDSSTAYTLYKIDRSMLSSGTWDDIETVTVDDTSYSVALAAGLGILLYSSPRFSTARRYDGATAAAVTGSPAGRAVAFHSNRFFVGGTAAEPSRLWYSNLGDYTKWWNEDASETALSNSTTWIDIGQDDGEHIYDLGQVEDGLLIAKRTSLWFLSGAGPDTFQLHKLNGGGGASGKCVLSTPYGAIITGYKQVWFWAGGAVENISKAIEDSYEITGDFVTTAYADGVAYICDEGTGNVYALDIPTGTWWVEKVDSSTEEPACIASRDDLYVYSPQAGTTISLLAYRNHPKGARGLDAGSIGETFKAHTPEIWLGGPNDQITPRRLYFKFRQRGGNAAQTGVTVTPVYNGTAESSQIIDPQASAGTYRDFLDVGSKRGINSVQYRFEQTVPSGQASLIDLEEISLWYDLETER